MTDVPEADAIEQRTPVEPGSENLDFDPDPDPEVPEADAIEQSQVVAADDEDHPR